MKNPKEVQQQKKETAQSPRPGTKPTGPQKPGHQGTSRPESPKR